MERDGSFPLTINGLDAAWNVLYQLEQAGYQAYLVGGCVRDLLLGVSPNDFDIATNALPEEVQKLFAKTIPTGIRHGTVSVLINGEKIEVTTFRTEGEYSKARRPNSVIFVDSLEQDLARRDFTINAMAMDRKGKLYDPFNGTKDLNDKLIRAVGVANHRFTEDALRMMRAVRFAASLTGRIEDKTWEAILLNADCLEVISKERTRDEWNKILRSDVELGIEYLTSSHMIKYVFPFLNTYIKKGLLAAASFTNQLPEKLELRQAAFFWKLGVSPVEVQKNLRYLRQSNTIIKCVTSILQAIPRGNPLEWNDPSWRHYLYKFGKDATFDAMLILGNQYPQDKNLIMSRFHDFVLQQPIWSTHDLPLNGQDLMYELKMKPGSAIGQILKQLAELVLTDPSRNNHQELLNSAKQILVRSEESSKKV